MQKLILMILIFLTQNVLQDQKEISKALRDNFRTVQSIVHPGEIGSLPKSKQTPEGNLNLV